MAFKVTKNFGKYSIIKDDWLEKWLIVDVESGQSVYGGYHLGTLKEYAGALESGLKPPTDFDWSYDYGNPIDMPKSLKAKQAQLQKQAQAQAASEASGIAKPIGSHAPSIVEVTDKGAYKVAKMSDGTYGMFVPSTGQSKLGMSSKAGASKSGNLAAKKHAASILEGKGVDPGSNAVDTLIDLYEGRVREMYGQAYREMAAKQASFMERFHDQQAEMIAKHDAGEITQAELKRWYEGQAAMAQRNTQMVNALADDLAKADKHAMAMLNGYMVPSYSENFAYATYQIEKAAKVSTSFSLYNRNAVVNILKDPDKALLPTIDDAADLAWCRRKVSSCIAQSILQGDSVPQAAARLESVVGMGANSAVRAARTALTGAQNLGRLDAGERAREMGIELMKQWVSTVDDRTRDSHIVMDRETVELDESFSNGCDCPGDPSGDPSEVYNCRCTMRFVLPGHEYDDIPSVTKEGQDYEEWKEAAQGRLDAQADNIQSQLDAIEEEKSQIMSALPEDKVYSGIWKDDVKLSEYESKIESIPKKQEYYENKILTAGDDAYGKMSAAYAQKNLDKLAEFEELGKAYADAHGAVQGQLDTLAEKEKQLKGKLSKLVGTDSYSDERKAAALRWADKQEADDVLRGLTSRAWKEATAAERDAIWGYTDGSGKYNRPLSGFQGGWGPYNFKGVGNVDLDYEGGKQLIRDATTFIERSKVEQDFWVRRGCGTNAMDSFFGTDFGVIGGMSDAELQQFIGHSNRISGFLSCGTASEGGAGFGGDVDMKIFIPKGTEAVYAEPFSSYTGASYDGRRWDGAKKQSYFGTEDETIIQRGASYTCTKVEKRGYNGLYVELEVHPELGYDKWGQFD